MAKQPGGSHYKLNAPPYQPRTIQFYGAPSASDGSILTDECVQAYGVINAFGTDSAKQKYVSFYFKGSTGGPAGVVEPAPATHQLADIGSHFTLTADAAAAVGHGTANTRAEFLTGMKIAGGLSASNTPVANVGGCQSTTVTCAKVGSLYKAICDSFQHNLNVGADGG